MVSPSPFRGRLRRAGLFLAVMFVCAVAVFPAVTIGAHRLGDQDEKKVGICHATGSEDNPFVEQSPAIGNNGDLQGGHLDHPNDIIPPYDYVDPNGNPQTFPGRNWTPENQAIWQNGCRPVTPPDPLTPTLHCVEDTGDGLLAHFGYRNPNPTSLTPPASQNRFPPPPEDRGQPATFASGDHDDAFQAELTSDSLTWSLTGNEVTASSDSSRCTGSITVTKRLTPTDDRGRFNLMIDGEIRGTGAAVGDGGTTGTIEVDTGPRTVSETAASGTSLDDYTTQISCRNGDREVGDRGSSLVITVRRGDAWVSVADNNKKPAAPDLQPILDCVLFNDGGADVAFWGYENTGDSEVTILRGSQRNRFTPGPAVRPGQPEVFETGRHTGVFRTPFEAGSTPVVWHLAGHEQAASESSLPCNPTVELRKVTISAADPGVFQLRIEGAQVATGGNGTTSGALRTGIGEGTVSETAAPGTNLADYDSKVECSRNGTVEVSVPGTKVDGEVRRGDTVVCTFTNTRKGAPPEPATPPPPAPPPPTPPPVPPPPPGPAPLLDLVVTKSVEPTTVVVGGRLTWTMTVTNRSAVAAADVNGLKLDDPRSFRTRLISLRASQGTCRPFTCDLGRVAPGASATVTAVTVATRVGVVVDMVRVGSEEVESNYRNNVAAALARVIGPLGPPVASKGCRTLTVEPRSLQRGRSSVTRLTARDRSGRRLAGVVVRAIGAGVNKRGVTSSDGVVRFPVTPAREGIVEFVGGVRNVAAVRPKCRTLLGVLGAQDTPVTG